MKHVVICVTAHKTCMTSSLFTWSKNYLDRDLDCNLDCNLDRDPEDVAV